MELLDLSSLFYSFQCIDFSPPWMSLFLSIFLDAIVHMFVFLISFLDNLLLIYRRNTAGFCILILNPATLLNSFINPKSFLMNSLEFSMYGIMSSANTDSFTSSFLIWMTFMYFSFLIALSRTSRTRLTRSGKNAYPHLAPDLGRKALSFSPLSLMLAVVLSYTAFTMLKYIPSVPKLLRVFIMKRC